MSDSQALEKAAREAMDALIAHHAGRGTSPQDSTVAWAIERGWTARGEFDARSSSGLTQEQECRGQEGPCECAECSGRPASSGLAPDTREGLCGRETESPRYVEHGLAPNRAHDVLHYLRVVDATGEPSESLVRMAEQAVNTIKAGEITAPGGVKTFRRVTYENVARLVNWHRGGPGDHLAKALALIAVRGDSNAH